MSKHPLNLKQDNTYWEWSQDLNYIEILWIMETEDNKFYWNKKKIKIGVDNRIEDSNG